MDKKMKALALGVSSAVVASGAAMAYTAGDVNTAMGTINLRNNFQVDVTNSTTVTGKTSGTICQQTGITCTSVATDSGYLQRQISDGTNTYIQSIVVDPGNGTGTAATYTGLDFVDSSLINMSGYDITGGAGGIATESRNVDTSWGYVKIESALRKDQFWNRAKDFGNTANLKFDQVVAENSAGTSATQGTNDTSFYTAFQFQEVASDMGAAATDAGKILRVAQRNATADGTQSFRMSRLNNSTSNTAQPYSLYTAGTPVTVGGTPVVAATTVGGTELEFLWIGNNFGGAMGLENVAGVQVGSATGQDARRFTLGTTGWTAGSTAGGTPGNGFSWADAVSTGQGGNAIYLPQF
ncbi:MAG: hypothetical protein D6698_10175 [Gammaproteobacteria bacterium]|nr:MAG: hypothetical protein D6698_10175 [Gammaproteobacteria bacterium]